MEKTNNRQAVFPGLLLILLLAAPHFAPAQTEKPEVKELLYLDYYNVNNSLQYIELRDMQKAGRIITPLSHKGFTLFLDSLQEPVKLGHAFTDTSGRARFIIPPALQPVWNKTAQHNVIAVKDSSNEPAVEASITKSRIYIDTANDNGTRTIIVKTEKLTDAGWMPAAAVDMKVGVKRLNALLGAGEEETYTSDSTGKVLVEWKLPNLPGDEKGNILLQAKVEGNDELGNLRIEKAVPWGTISKTGTNFFHQRALWSTRFRTPYWLLFMAYSIMICVWGTLLYLVFQLVKMGQRSGM